MVACDVRSDTWCSAGIDELTLQNDDCPMEWYHLACLGLQVAPTGNWLCNECKPKIGLGMGGAGTVQPGGMEKKAGKKRKRMT
jgi:hypothetical protein